MSKPSLVSSGVVAVFCVLALLVPGAASAKKITKTVTGVVTASESYKGKVVGVFIKDLQEGDFVVFRGTEVGKELLEHVGSTVTATGYIKKSNRDPGYDNGIDILTYEVLPPVEKDE